MKYIYAIAIMLVCAVLCKTSTNANAETLRDNLKKQYGVQTIENIFEPTFGECHASTLLETKTGGLLCAFFAGTREGANDVKIYASELSNGKWSSPKIIAESPDGKNTPCWNPVLFRNSDGSITLFYKSGKSAETWRGFSSISTDEGATWSEPLSLSPDDNLGPVKNKPVRVGKRIILPSSREFSAKDWRIIFWISDDDGKTWKASNYANAQNEIGGIQPSILVHKNGLLQAIGRTQYGFIYQTWSRDNGLTWSTPTSTGLPNLNSGTDATTLADGRHILVYNHSVNSKIRSPLNVAISQDGMKWYPLVILEDGAGEFSYPAVIQRKNGLIDISYTNRRKTISHAVLDPKNLRPAPSPMTAAWDFTPPESESLETRIKREDYSAEATAANQRALKNAKQRKLKK